MQGTQQHVSACVGAPGIHICLLPSNLLHGQHVEQDICVGVSCYTWPAAVVPLLHGADTQLSHLDATRLLLYSYLLVRG